MSYSKTKIYNLALSHLLLSRQVIDADTEVNNEVKVLNTFWEDALNTTLQELDLNSLASTATLELLENLDDEGPWDYVYKYPTSCSSIRRIVSNARVDTNRTFIAKKTAIRDSVKVIYTNKEDAVLEFISKDVPLETLDYSAGLAISYMLAFLCAPLIVGKGAKRLRDSIMEYYIMAKSKAQELDAIENFNYDNPAERSEFVAARIE